MSDKVETTITTKDLLDAVTELHLQITSDTSKKTSIIGKPKSFSEHFGQEIQTTKRQKQNEIEKEG